MGKCFDFLKSDTRNKFLKEMYGNQSGELYVDTHYWGLKGVKKLLVGEVLRISPRGPRVLLAKE